MKTLERFWQWFDGEKPDAVVAQVLARKNLSKLAMEALQSASSLIVARALPMCDWAVDGALKYSFEKHAPVLREVSLKLCEALQVLHEAIAELPIATFVTEPITLPGEKGFVREYLAHWIPAAPQQSLAKAEPQRQPTFTGRLFARYYDPQPVVLHPDHYKRLVEELDPEGKTVPLAHVDDYVPGCLCDRCQAACARREQQRNDYETRMQRKAALDEEERRLRAQTRMQQQVNDHQGLAYSRDMVPLGGGYAINDGSTLELTSTWVRYARWESIRGLAPTRVVLKGPLGEYQALGERWQRFYDEHLQVLVAGGAELVTE